MRTNLSLYILLSIAVLLLFASGCATVSAPDERDPWESYNRSVHGFNEAFDSAIGQPVAEAYQFIMPDFIETGVANFFSNINDIIVVVNDLLQFKLEQAALDFGRIVYNTTFGLLGLFDVASHMELPKHHEDFGQTLAVWGVGDGAYFVLPFLGPSTVRDTTGLVADAYIDPLINIRDNETRWGLIALRAVDKRASLLEATRIMEKSGIDSYVFMRNAYFQIRENQIHDGSPPATTTIIAPTKEDLDLEKELELELQRSPGK